MFGLKSRSPETVVLVPAATVPPPSSAPLLVKPVGAILEAMNAEGLRRYTEAAEVAGITQPLLCVEALKRFFADNEMAVYPLDKVVPYMDELAARESSNKLGWVWRPLRDKDQIDYVTWGKNADSNFRAKSDAYAGRPYRSAEYPIPNYDRVVPLKALRKVNKIEKEFHYHEQVKFFVSDYATARDCRVDPDPFLMAVICNPFVEEGTGRFVIDVWDEPGFGLKEALGIADVTTTPA